MKNESDTTFARWVDGIIGRCLAAYHENDPLRLQLLAEEVSAKIDELNERFDQGWDDSLLDQIKQAERLANALEGQKVARVAESIVSLARGRTKDWIGSVIRSLNAGDIRTKAEMIVLADRIEEVCAARKEFLAQLPRGLLAPAVDAELTRLLNVLLVHVEDKVAGWNEHLGAVEGSTPLAKGDE